MATAYILQEGTQAARELLSAAELTSLGVFHERLNAQEVVESIQSEAVSADIMLPAGRLRLDAICAERGYDYRDEVDSRKIPDLPSKLAMFFEEHMHDDEEIRFFLEGSGFFDVRDQRNGEDRWVRIECTAGDLIVLPAGIYHRFNPDKNMFFLVLRLFQGEPVWTAHNRANAETEKREARAKYTASFLLSKEKLAAAAELEGGSDEKKAKSSETA